MTYPYAAGAADHQELEWLGGGTMRILLDGDRTGGKFSMFRSSAPAGAASPAHVHTREDEIFVLLSGSAVYWVGDRRFEAGPGSVAFLPRGVPHAYRITSDADLLAMSTPSGLEGFFRGAGHDLSTPKPPGWTVTPETMGKAAADNGQIILGPPLDLDGTLPADGYPKSGGYVAQSDEHETLEWLGGGLMRILLNEQHTDGQLSLFRSSAPEGSASPVYVHHKEDETIVMLSGSGIYWVGEDRHELSAGGVVVVPRGVAVAHRITSDAETLAVTTPGGLESFFRMAGHDVSQPRPDGWQTSYELMSQAARATGQSILATPLEADEKIPEAVLGR